MVFILGDTQNNWIQTEQPCSVCGCKWSGWTRWLTCYLMRIVSSEIGTQTRQRGLVLSSLHSSSPVMGYGGPRDLSWGTMAVRMIKSQAMLSFCSNYNFMCISMSLWCPMGFISEDSKLWLMSLQGLSQRLLNSPENLKRSLLREWPEVVPWKV